MSANVFTIDRRRTARPTGTSWDARAYLSAYYSRLEPTEEQTLAFLHDALSSVPEGGRALDFGSGPTLHHAILLAGFVREVHVADFQPENLRAIQRWRMGAANAHDWSPFTRAALRLAGAPGDDAQLCARDALTRHRLTRVLRGDIRHRHPLGDAGRGAYQVVSSFFCADSITANLDEWRQYTRNLATLVAPGGWLMIGALRQCRGWRLGNQWLPSPCIDERHVRFVLDAAGFTHSVDVMAVPGQAGNGFESILLAAARAPAG